MSRKGHDEHTTFRCKIMVKKIGASKAIRASQVLRSRKESQQRNYLSKEFMAMKLNSCSNQELSGDHGKQPWS